MGGQRAPATQVTPPQPSGSRAHTGRRVRQQAKVLVVARELSKPILQASKQRRHRAAVSGERPLKTVCCWLAHCGHSLVPVVCERRLPRLRNLRKRVFF